MSASENQSAASRCQPGRCVAVVYQSVCRSYHKTLLAGKCPWCGCAVVKGELAGPHWRDWKAILRARIEQIGPADAKAVQLLCVLLNYSDSSLRLAAVNG